MIKERREKDGKRPKTGKRLGRHRYAVIESWVVRGCVFGVFGNFFF